MKKLFFIAAIAGAALVSCTKNELAPSATEQHEITFASPVVGVQTKAQFGAIKKNYNPEESFDVWAIYNINEIETWEVQAGGANYIVDKPVSFTGTATENGDGTYTYTGGWGFNPSYFWPANGYLSFVALSPTMGNNTTYDSTNGFKIETWSQGTNEQNIIDLMYSDESLNNAKMDFNEDNEESTDEDLTHVYDGVDITFNHALSYLVFQIKTSADYSQTTRFRLTGVVLKNIYNTGSFTQKTKPGTPNWVVVTEDIAPCTYTAYSGSLPFGTTAVAVPETATKEMILLPQPLTADTQQIEISYQISTDEGTTWIDQKQTAYFAGNGVASWEMGKKYTYTITIGMTEIIFDPAVSEWTTATGGDIEL